jgi:hypothetical protein
VTGKLLTGRPIANSKTLFVGQPPGPNGQSLGPSLSLFAPDNLALQSIPEPATLLTFGATASLLLGLRRRRAR